VEVTVQQKSSEFLRGAIFGKVKDIMTWGILLIIGLISVVMTSCNSVSPRGTRWHEKYDFVADIPPIVFNYDHGVLAGSYPEDQETVAVRFDDVCAYLGHVCLCGAGGYRIVSLVVDSLHTSNEPLERGEFILVSSRDHTISDVIAYVLGIQRRQDPSKSNYFIDTTITAPRREYHYYIGFKETRTAVHVIYRKHQLIGHDAMDALWKIELSYDADPQSVSKEDISKYQRAMKDLVSDVVLGRRDDVFDIVQVPYEQVVTLLLHD